MVIVSELANNPGTSVTNAIGQIAAEVNAPEGTLTAKQVKSSG